jgi:hypothetical protein
MGSEDAHGRRSRSSRPRVASVAPLALWVVCTFLALVVALTVAHAVRRVVGGEDLSAVVDLIGTLLWPAVLLFVVARFEQSPGEFFNAVTVSA